MVYNSIGKDAFPASLDCLKPLGMWVSFGEIVGAGAIVQDHAALTEGVAVRHPPVDHRLHQIPQGSGGNGRHLFEVIAKGKVKVAVNQTYALAPTRPTRNAT